MYYLGKYGSEASRQEYDRAIAEFVANGRQPFHCPDEILVESLIVRFLDHVEKNLNYTPATQSRVVRAVKVLNALYGKTAIVHFTASALKTLRQKFLDEGLSRITINNYITVIKQVFYWGHDEAEIVSDEVYNAVKLVKQLRAGRTSAVDYDKVEPVDDAIVEKTLPYLYFSTPTIALLFLFANRYPSTVHFEF